MRRGFAGLGFLAVAFAGYVAINGDHAAAADIALPVDEAMPFVPWSLLVYLSFYPVLLATPFVLEEAAFWRLFRSAGLATLVAWAFFWWMPVPCLRPEAVTGAWGPAYALLHRMDQPANTFPSLHVAGSYLVAFALEKPGWLAWATVVSLSTMTTRQHFLLDVIGGLALAMAAWRLAR